MKIYSDDEHVHYKTTEVSALRSRHMIDGILAEWDIKDSAWHWDPTNQSIFIEFSIKETIQETMMAHVVHVDAPLIWKRSRAGGHGHAAVQEELDWNVSLRVMWWFIKTHLEAAYLTQSSKTLAFLPLIRAEEEGKTLGSIILGNLERIQRMPALDAPKSERIIVQEER